MKKVNVKELTQRLNEFISSKDNEKRTFTGKELHGLLVDLGFSNGICYKITNSLFPFEQVGKNRLYEVPKKPIYIGIIEGIYKSSRNAKNSYNKKKEFPKSTNMNEDEAWQLLIDKGLVKRIFDINKLKAKYPTIYLECLRYEVV